MYVIGLTGGIASGKSTVSRILKRLGAAIIDADEIARELAAPQGPLWRAFVNHFGEKVLQADASLDRRKIGEIVFSDKREKTWIDEASHPIIKACVEKELEKYRAKKTSFVVLDVPLLYEVNWQSMADEVWVVYVDAAIQLQRLISRDSLSQNTALGRIAAQMPLTKKVAMADFVIDNNGEPSSVEEQVLKRWAFLEGRG